MKNLCLGLLLVLGGCSGGTTTGNPVTVSVRVVDEQPFAWWKPVRNTLLIPEAHAATTDIFFCFKRLRFKFDSSGTGGSGNIDLNLGRVAIDPNGTSLGTVTIPAGSYDRIEIDLENECDGVASRPSVEFTNLNAPFSYSTEDRLTVKFDGTFTATENATVDLNIDLLIDAMDTVTPADDIKDVLEAVSGDY